MSADVDAAREALYAEADDYEHRVRVEAFEAAIRAEARAAALDEEEQT